MPIGSRGPDRGTTRIGRRLLVPTSSYHALAAVWARLRIDPPPQAGARPSPPRTSPPKTANPLEGIQDTHWLGREDSQLSRRAGPKSLISPCFGSAICWLCSTCVYHLAIPGRDTVGAVALLDSRTIRGSQRSIGGSCPRHSTASPAGSAVQAEEEVQNTISSLMRFSHEGYIRIIAKPLDGVRLSCPIKHELPMLSSVEHFDRSGPHRWTKRGTRRFAHITCLILLAPPLVASQKARKSHQLSSATQKQQWTQTAVPPKVVEAGDVLRGHKLCLRCVSGVR